MTVNKNQRKRNVRVTTYFSRFRRIIQKFNDALAEGVFKCARGKGYRQETEIGRIGVSEILTTVEWLGVCVRARASVRGGVSGVRVRVSQQNVGRQVHRPYARGEKTPRGLPSPSIDPPAQRTRNCPCP